MSFAGENAARTAVETRGFRSGAGGTEGAQRQKKTGAILPRDVRRF
jgi:hypothetical protein